MELNLDEMLNESDMIQGGVIPTKKVVEKQRKQTEMIKRIKAHHQQQTNQQENLDLDDVVSMLSSIGFGPTLRKRSTKQPSVKVDDTKQSNREKKTTSKLVSKSSKTVKSTSTAKSTSTTTKTKISKVFAKPMIKEIKDRLISLYHPELVPYFKQKLMKYDGFVDNNLADMNVVDFLMEKYAKDLIEPVLKKAIKGLTKIQIEGMYDDSTLVTYSYLISVFHFITERFIDIIS